MAHLARVVAADVPHHVTQRGNARRFLLSCDAELRGTGVEGDGVEGDKLDN